MANKATVSDAIIAGIFLGSVRCIWDRYQLRKQEIDK